MAGLVRVGGAFRVAGGVAVAAAGLGTSSTGLGILLAGWGGDQIGTGIGEIFTGASNGSLGSRGARACLGDGWAGNIVGTAYDVAPAAGLSLSAFLKGRGVVSVPRTAQGPRLVHMTEAADAISQSGRLGLPSDIYAGPASNAGRSGWALTRRTGLDPRGAYRPVWIPEAAEAAFHRPLPVGPFTAWQRVTGQRCSARGIIDLGTGRFTRTGVNRTQAGWYAIDVGITGTAVGAGGLYGISSGGGGE